jgi:hypothetical protein
MAIVKDDGNKHLSAPEKAPLLELLQEFEELLDWTLGVWGGDPVSLELKEGATPYHDQPFPITKKHLETTKKEIQ